MKKILIALIALILFAAAAAAIFVATFDANKYKSLIESKASEALGGRVAIGSIQLRLAGGIALGIQRLELFEKDKTAPELSAENVRVSLKLLPLLRKSVEIGGVLVDRPRLTLIREGGVVRVSGIHFPTQHTSGGTVSSEPPAAAPAFAAERVSITEAEIVYRDVTPAGVSQITAKHLNVTLKNVSLAGPVRFEADAAVFGEETDVRLKGEVSGLAGGKPELRDFTASADLGMMDFALVTEAVPAIKQAGLRRDISGKIEVRIDRAVMGPAGPENLNAKFKMTGGRAGLTALKPYFENVSLDASVDDKDARLDGLSMQFSGGTVRVKGMTQDYRKAPRSEADLAVQGVRIDPLVPVTAEGKPLVEGAVSLAFKGSAAGAGWPDMSRTMNGEATLELPQGVKLNLNIIRELLGKLSMFPGIVSTLEKNLPESYRPKLTQQSTILNPVRHVFPVRDGTVQVRDLKVSTDFFNAGLNADVQLSGALEGNGVVQLDKTFSKGMLDGFPQAEVLANNVSQIELPLILKGAGGKVSVLPDIQKIVGNLASGGGAKALSGLLSGVTGKNRDAAAAGQPASSEAAPAKKDKLSGWLDKISNAVDKKPDEPAPAAQQ